MTTLADLLPPGGLPLSRHHSPEQLINQLIFVGELVCFILILMRLGKEKGALHVILGIISLGIYPFIWGWIHAKRLGAKKIMIVWTVLAVAGVIMTLVGR